MDYKIVEKDEFKVIGVYRKFKYDSAFVDVPEFWNEHISQGKSCYGPSSTSMQETNKKIFSEWLPNCKDYEIAAGYNIEMYSDSSECEKGILDENYYREVWI